MPGQGWSGLPDAALWERVAQEGVMFMTADKGLGDIRAYPPGTHAGIILLRPDRESLPEFQRLAQAVADRYDLDALRGTLTIVSPHRIRIRR